jgi:hypothetical protein
MRVRRREQTISENLALWEAFERRLYEANELRLKKIRRALWRLEWRARFRSAGRRVMPWLGF